jgi:histidine ammonia-lyase
LDQKSLAVLVSDKVSCLGAHRCELRWPCVKEYLVLESRVNDEAEGLYVQIEPGKLRLRALRESVYNSSETITLDESCRTQILSSFQTVSDIAHSGVAAYGINTGFGRLASTRIAQDQLELLQRNLVLSHAVGVGAPLPIEVVRLSMILKVASLARGSSGVRMELIEALIQMFNSQVLPVIPSKGSVGASGDLAPLAHLAASLLGVGEVTIQGTPASAIDGLRAAGLSPMTLAPKEGLALLNGTQISTALALANLFRIEEVFKAAVVAGALSVDAAAGSVVPFDERIHQLRGHRGQIDVAASLRSLLRGSTITISHQDCDKVQDPYSLRCQPQVMGAILDTIRYCAGTLEIEANAVSDNPIVFPETGEVLSGGNFHGEPVAIAADALAIAASEIGALSERRIALLIDASLSGLPPFLIRDGGVNSGFMIAHVTAAALASENKSLAHPASVDSLPTSANQEDHVSMATFAARRLGDIADNVASIVGIELLAACQGVDLRSPLTSSAILEQVRGQVREIVPHYDIDHFLAPDIHSAHDLITTGVIGKFCGLSLPSDEVGP